MLVLIITLVPTISVNAQSYVTDDTIIIGSNIHDYFNNYFSGNKSYQYFGYVCGERTCYYGIDSDNNYVNITYLSTGGYSYNYQITTGVDESFSVTGNNIFKKEVNNSRVILYSLAFMFGIIIVALLNREVY